MDEARIIAELTDIFHDLFADDNIVVHPGLTADDVADWDSIKHISLIVAVEDRFGFRTATSEIEGLRNVGELIAIIQSKVA